MLLFLKQKEKELLSSICKTVVDVESIEVEEVEVVVAHIEDPEYIQRVEVLSMWASLKRIVAALFEHMAQLDVEVANNIVVSVKPVEEHCNSHNSLEQAVDYNNDAFVEHESRAYLQTLELGR